MIYLFFLLFTIFNLNKTKSIIKLITFWIIVLILINTDQYFETILISLGAIIYYIIKYNKIQNLILFVIFIGSSVWLIKSNNLISIWLALECQSFSLILLLFYSNKTLIINIEAILKYFFVSAISSVIILLGIFNLTICIESIVINPNLFWGSSINPWFLIIIPLAFKLALAPIHIWVPEVYQGLSFIGIILISIIPKWTLIIVLIKLPLFNLFFILIGIFSIVIGSIGGLNQIEFKPLIGYSGISHLGFVIISLSNSFYSGITISYFYLITYLITTLGVLIILYKSYNKSLIIQWTNFISFNKLNTFIFITLILSWLGFPPLAGFLAKWVIILNLYKADNLLIIIIIIILSIMLSSFYYLRLIKINSSQSKNFYSTWEDSFIKSSINIELNYFTIINWLFILILLINPNPLFLFCSLFKWLFEVILWLILSLSLVFMDY